MRYILLLITILHPLFSDTLFSPTDTNLLSILHTETEEMIGRDTKDLPKQRNSYSSLYAELLVNYGINENLFLSFGTKANLVIDENIYKTPIYSRTKMDSDDINKIILSETSINYDNSFFSLNAGRINVDYDWLLGSIDGAIVMLGTDDDTSLRLFWFEHYRLLQYNYYMKIENINENRGMQGIIAKTNLENFEFSFFDYYIQDIRNIYGGHLNFTNDNFGVNLSYSVAKAEPLAAYDYDETYLCTSLEFLNNHNYYEVGFSKTGQNGLLAMIQMGNSMFGQFYLNNQVDRENALNGFFKYIYAFKNWRSELIFGMSQYDNNFVVQEKEMFSKELDFYLKYSFDKHFSIDTGAMYMDVDERDPLQVDQTFMMLNLVYSYENI